MSVLSANIPAIAGGRPMFDERVPIVSPEGLPGEEFLRDVRRMLAAVSLPMRPSFAGSRKPPKNILALRIASQFPVAPQDSCSRCRRWICKAK
jgi:hypothetical protein